MITIAVPPALPACLTIATVFSINRLRRRDVYVTGPDRITMAGQLDVIAFDKTGTLTEQGLDLHGIVPILNGRAFNMVTQVRRAPLRACQLPCLPACGCCDPPLTTRVSRINGCGCACPYCFAFYPSRARACPSGANRL